MLNLLKSFTTTTVKPTNEKRLINSKAIENVYNYMLSKEKLIEIVDDIIQVGKLCLSVKGMNSTKGKKQGQESDKTRRMKALGIDIFSDSERHWLGKIANKPLQFKALVKSYVDANKRLDGYETLAGKLEGMCRARL